MSNIIDKLKWNTPDAISEDERNALTEKYKNLQSDFEKMFPPHIPTPEEIEIEKLKKKYKFHKGDIYALKDGAQIWVIPLQYCLTYHREDRLDPMYVQVNSWAWNNCAVFCHRVEKNLFGMLDWKQCELEVAFESLDLSKKYKEKEMVKPFPWIDYVYNEPKENKTETKDDN